VYNSDSCVTSENIFNGIDITTKKTDIKKISIQNDILEQIKNLRQINGIEVSGCSSVIQIYDKQMKDILTIDGECLYTFGTKVLNVVDIGKILCVSNIPKGDVKLNNKNNESDIRQVDINFSFSKYIEYFNKNKDKIIKISSVVFIWILIIYILKQVTKL